jgi:hypothetical protein
MPFPLNPSPRRELNKPASERAAQETSTTAQENHESPGATEAPNRHGATNLQRTFPIGTACGSRSTRPTGTR